MDSRKSVKRWGGIAGLIATGAVAGGILASTVSASADESSTSSTPSTSQSAVDPSQPQRSDEQLLTGDTKTKVEAAVLAKYPGATIERTETDSGGVYESHVVTIDGNHVIVEVGSDFTVTGTDTGGPGGGPGGGHGGRGGAPAGGTTGESGGA